MTLVDLMCTHLHALKEKFDEYFFEEMKICQPISWMANPFQIDISTAYPNSSAAALKVLHPFKSSYLCEIGFPVMVAMKTQFRNRLQLFESLRLKVTAIEVDIYAVIKAT
ncbi:Protein ZBED8 [Trichinella pseudospiralis]|uniref:Protein ZBED8 n=1 Tax=Trichinella pseudospiralis TaxID=6337 RepID=A0A0V1E9U9_TRIPS|nr:Protein ZBED8 [Trichinella pseudospiralis]